MRNQTIIIYCILSLIIQITVKLTVIFKQSIQGYRTRMRIKDKFMREKQLTDRPQGSLKNTDSTPLLARLEKQYLFNQPHPHKTSRDPYMQSSRGGEKQNYANMVNSVPSMNEYISHNVIKIDNYEGRRFKTQQGYEPQMIKSRYVGDKDQADQNFESSAVYKSSENIILRRDKPKKIEQKIYESVDLTQNQRPLTFGLVRKTQPMKSSVQYQEDIRMKNQVLNQLSTLRRSQQTLIASKDYSTSGIGDGLRCANHNNKKAKYRLLTEPEGKQDEQMIYCSKCAINLLQQGFKVDEIKQGTSQITRKLSKNQQQFLCHSNINMMASTGTSSRLQQMRNFQHKLSEVQSKIYGSLQESSLKTGQIQQIERQMWQTESLYDQMIEHLNNMKKSEITDLTQLKKKKFSHLKKYQKQLNQQLENILEMKKQMKEFRNKFIIMKENQFQFLISSFQNKIQTFGCVYKEGEAVSKKVENQIDQIIIDLCQFCKQMKDVDESRKQSAKFENKSREIQLHATQDEFICKEIKGPFRTLFPEEENNSASGRKQPFKCDYGQENDSPSFNRYQTHLPVEPLHRSIKNNQMYKH